MSEPEWKRYVRTMCNDAWDLDPRAASRAIEALEALMADDRVSDSTVADVLFSVGLSEFVADLAAPSIRAAIDRSIRAARGRDDDCGSQADAV